MDSNKPGHMQFTSLFSVILKIEIEISFINEYLFFERYCTVISTFSLKYQPENPKSKTTNLAYINNTLSYHWEGCNCPQWHFSTFVEILWWITFKAIANKFKTLNVQNEWEWCSGQKTKKKGGGGCSISYLTGVFFYIYTYIHIYMLVLLLCWVLHDWYSPPFRTFGLKSHRSDLFIISKNVS